jgi:excisionase family DNA binding protein
VIEHVLADLLRAAIAPLAEELRLLRVEVERLRQALPPLLVTTREAAERLGISEFTVRRQIKVGTIPARRVGRS